MAKFELIIHPKTLYKLIFQNAYYYEEDIEDFRIDLKKNLVQLSGHIKRGEEFSDRLLNLTSYVFSLKLVYRNYDPINQIVEFDLYNFEGRDRYSSIFNMLGSVNAIANFIKRETIRKICHPSTPYSHNEEFSKFYIDLSYYLSQIPPFLGKIHFLNVRIERRKLVIICKSNFVARMALHMWTRHQSRLKLYQITPQQ